MEFTDDIIESLPPGTNRMRGAMILISHSLYSVPTQIPFSSSVCFPSLPAIFPCANLDDL